MGDTRQAACELDKLFDIEHAGDISPAVADNHPYSQFLAQILPSFPTTKRSDHFFQYGNYFVNRADPLTYELLRKELA